MIVIGGIAGLLVLGYAFFNILVQDSSFISNGPLTSNHANFEQDCAACHTSGSSLTELASVTNDKCSACHEKYGDKLGVYTFAAHYIYRSGDFRRLVHSENETPCFSCHGEHLGREAKITQVKDARCLVCHEFGSFNEMHPQFEFAARQVPDNSNLKFPHVRHIKEVQKSEDLLDIEKTCLYCHNPESDGRNFQPINFERHCDACHLTTSTATPWLEIKDGGRNPGVETLSTIRRRQRPGTLWSYYTNENEFTRRGNRVRKSPIYHQDPWIMENLSLARRILYPALGLVDLLRSSEDVPPRDAKLLYEEAIQTLRNYSIGLRSRPEPQIQKELVRINRYLEEVEEKLRDPYSSLDDTKFLLSTLAENPNLTRTQLDKFDSFINSLTEPCQKCHVVSNATILRVQKDQRVLRRAEFNHRDHILQRRCLECHTQIPFQEFLSTSTNVDPTRDRSEIQNIPTIEACQDCHQADQASNRCVTCHYFHPNKTQRSNLLLYLD